MAIRPIAVKYAELSAANGDRHQLNYPIQFVVGWIDRIRLIRSEGADNNLAHIKSIKPSQPGWNSVELFSCLLRIMYVSMPRIIGHNTNISALLPFLDGNKMKNVKIPCLSRRNFQTCILIDCDSIQLCDNIQIETSHRIHIKLETWVEAVYFGGMFYDSHSIHKTGIIRLGKLKLFCALPLLPMLSNLLWICAMYQLNWQNRKNSHVCGYVSGTVCVCVCVENSLRIQSIKIWMSSIFNSYDLLSFFFLHPYSSHQQTFRTSDKKKPKQFQFFQIFAQKIPYSHIFRAKHLLQYLSLLVYHFNISVDNTRTLGSTIFLRSPVFASLYAFILLFLAIVLSSVVHFSPAQRVAAAAKNRPLPLLNYLQCNPCLPEFSSKLSWRSLSFTFSPFPYKLCEKWVRIIGKRKYNKNSYT